MISFSEIRMPKTRFETRQISKHSIVPTNKVMKLADYKNATRISQTGSNTEEKDENQIWRHALLS